MLRRLGPLALALAALLLPACDATADAVLGGTYTGVLEQTGALTTTATFTIPETASGESFAFQVVVAEGAAGGPDEARFSGTGVYEHPAVLLRFDGDATGGIVADDGRSFRLETAPGTFATFTRE